jgi:hypothetical protein
MRQNAAETIDFPTSLPVPKNMMALAISYFLFKIDYAAKGAKNKISIFYYASKTSTNMVQPTATQAERVRRAAVLLMCCGSGSGPPLPSHGLSF